MTGNTMLPLQRRAVLKCASGAFPYLAHSISLLAGLSARRHQDGLGRANWNEFVEQIRLLAESHSHGSLTSADFVQMAAKIGSRLDTQDTAIVGAYDFLRARQAAAQSPSILAGVKREVTFEIVLLVLESGYSIPLHDHPMRSGVSICVKGEAKVTNYDLRDTAGVPRLKMRSRMTIGATQAGTLTEAEGNVHTITAVQRTHLIDIFSPPTPPTSGFHWYTAEPESKDGTILRVTSVK